MVHCTTRAMPLLALALGLALSVFLVDVVLPLGVVVGIPYVVVVLACARLPWRAVVGLALGCTGLTLLGGLLSPPGAPLWMDLTNRALALSALWVTVAVVYSRQRGEAALRQAHDALEQQVAQRTAAWCHAIAERQQAEVAVHASAAQLRSVLEINKTLGQVRALPALLTTIAAEAARLLSVPEATFRLCEGEELGVVATWEPEGTGRTRRRLRVGKQTLSGWVAATGEPLLVHDITQDARFVPEDRAQRLRCGHSAYLGVPLRWGAEVLGVLSFRAGCARPFTDHDRDVAMAFADQAALAVQQARQYTQAEQRRMTAESLMEVTQLLSESLDPVEVGRRIVDTVTTLVGAQGVVLYALAPQAGTLQAIAFSQEFPRPRFQTHSLSQGAGVTGLAMQTRRPAASPNIFTDPRLTLAPEVRAQLAQGPPRAGLAVPLLLHEAVLGVLALVDAAGRAFTADEIALVQAFATQAATALHNAQRYQQQVHREEEVRTLLEINKTLGQVRELPVLLNAIAAEAARLLAVPEVTFRLCEGRALRLVGAWAPAGSEAALASVAIEGSLTGQVVQSGVPLRINDITQEDRFLAAGHARLMRQAYVAYLGVPLRVGTEVIGMMVCNAPCTRPFTDHDQEVAVAFADQAAIAIQQARLYTQVQQAYADLQQTQQVVVQQERLRALGQMASGIAHDLNNTLAPAALYVGALLQRDLTLSAHARKYLTTVQQVIQDVAHTIARLGEVYRPPGSLQDALPLDLNALVSQVIELTRPRWRDQPQQHGRTITVHTVLAAHLPRVRGVASEVREALLNLVFNAIDAMPQGGTLTLQTRATPTAVLVEVQDTGIGMDEETRQRCLEPFYTTKGDHGTGLGLAMVYGILERHAAHLDIESARGQGTTMRLRFPRAQWDGARGGPPAESQEPVAPLRILVIDDEPLLRQVLQDVLQSEGHEVTLAEGGSAGLAAFYTAQTQHQPFTVVVTDLGMPDMDGQEVAREVKQHAPATPVILLTGWGETLRHEGTLPPHIDHILNKPADLSALRAALVTVTAARRRR